jgi:DNA (cytosine-5)-methyltransferase 1
MKHLDLFTGYGGFTIAAQKKNWETVGHSEIDKYANAVLEYNFNIKNYGNVCDIDFRQFRGEIDIITGGTPCQDLSVAGKGKGLEGERSGLFFEFIRAVTESKATYFVWENVKGALWSNKGWDFARVQIEMEQAGYDVWWQVINAKDFGVPQNRERIFAIGIRKGSGREILFEQRESGKDIEKIINTGHDGTNIFDTDGTGVTLKANGGGQGAKTGLYAISRGRSDDPWKETNTSPSLRIGDKENVRAVAIPSSNGNVHSLDANYWKGSNNPNKSRRSQIAVPMRWSRTEKGKQARREAQENGRDYTPFNKGHRKLEESSEDVSGCITNALNKDSLLKQDMRIRRLTPTECERLMGLEDNWTAKGIMDGKEVEISDTQRYKMCGNGVVVQCVDYIFDLIE